MISIFNPGNAFDRPPFQWARMSSLSGRLDSNQAAYAAHRASIPGRIDSNHLLVTLLKSVKPTFNGDPYKYMADCEAICKSVVPAMGLTSAYGKGDIFKQGVFYPGCPELILYVRDVSNGVMDLWSGWKKTSPIKIIMHPVSDLSVFEMGVTNPARLSHTGLAIIVIDIPLLATQYRMHSYSRPGMTEEEFITQVVLPNAFRGHTAIAIFNKVQVALGIKPECAVRSNLPFMQSEVDLASIDLVKEMVGKVAGKSMSPNQVINCIPYQYGEEFLRALAIEGAIPNYQMTWVLILQKAEAFATAMAFCRQFGYDKAVREVMIARRTVSDAESDKYFANGLTTAARLLAEEMFQRLVIDNLPAQ